MADSIVSPLILLAFASASSAHIYRSSRSFRRTNHDRREPDSPTEEPSNLEETVDPLPLPTTSGTNAYSPLLPHFAPELERDPIDSSLVPSFVDGEPLHVEEFWRSVRIRKAIVVVLVALLLVSRCFQTGWDAIVVGTEAGGDPRGGGFGWWDIVEDVLMLAFWIITLVMAVLALTTESIALHWRYLIHLSVLTFTALTILAFRLLIPTSTLSPAAPPSNPGSPTLHSDVPKLVAQILTYVDFVLVFVTFLVAGTTNRSPDLYYISPYLADKAEPPALVEEIVAGEEATRILERGEKEKDQRKANVSPIATSSVLSYLLFNWADPVVEAGHKSEQLAQSDLPQLTADLRALNLFMGFKQSIFSSIRKTFEPAGVSLDDGQGVRIQAGDLGPAPSWMNKLLWRLLMINKTAFLLQVILASAAAVIYYLPAFFLQKLVRFLEVKDTGDGTGSDGSVILGFMFGIWGEAEGDGDLVMQMDGGRQGDRKMAYGYLYCAGLLASLLLDALVQGQLWFLSNSLICSKLRVQINTLIYSKTLRRKDISGVSAAGKADAEAHSASHAASSKSANGGANGNANGKIGDNGNGKKKKGAAFGKESEEEESFGSKSQVMNLFSVDVDRIADFGIWSFSLVDAPMELLIGTIFLYNLLGVAAIIGIATQILFLPLNHFTSKYFAVVQDKLMAARDKRVSLMNEVLQSIRMIKFNAWESAFEEKILESRAEELKQQKRNFLLEVAFNFIWLSSPIICVLVSFLWYAKVQHEELTPSIAFTSLAVFNELRFAINVIPDTLIQGLQCLVSLRRIQKYLTTAEVDLPPASAHQTQDGDDDPVKDLVALRNATITWPSHGESKSVVTESGGLSPGSHPVTPSRRSFILEDISADFPTGQLSLICGSLGSGKTLLLLGLLGEASVLAGQVLCPRSPPDAIPIMAQEDADEDSDDDGEEEEEWLKNHCAFVPQSAWLQNASIRDNILFGLPYKGKRYRKVLSACSLVGDLAILEDGDQTEIGEKGVNLSGGQKARVSLARAVYSRAKTLLMDDVLSAVDAHTARHIFDECLKGPLLRDRTVILVSHHVQLCAPGASYVVALENGSVKFSGEGSGFLQSEHFKDLAGGREEDEAVDAAKANQSRGKPKNKAVQALQEPKPRSGVTSSASSVSELDTETESESESEDEKEPEKTPKKLIEDETRAVGHVGYDVWFLYLKSSGGLLFWAAFVASFLGAKVLDVLETWWLRVWSGSNDVAGQPTQPRHSINYYLGIYAVITMTNVCVSTARWLSLYDGGIRASTLLYKSILRSVLRAPLRFFDTIALGRLLNRFGKDFEGVDSQLPDHFGRTLIYGLGVATTVATIASAAPIFLIGFGILSIFYYYFGRMYSTTARELRRLDSVSKSPLYSIYGETINGVAVIRAFGACTRFMVSMLHRVDSNIIFYYYLWSVNRWLSIRFSLLSALVVGLTGFVLLQAGDKVDAAIAGFALTFALNISGDMLFLVRRFTALELALVACERIKEYSEIQQEAAEIVEPRPPAAWPHSGEVSVESLHIRYAADLPDVLHGVSFHADAAMKVGIVGATGCGKSTLALSFFRFVEAHDGRIVIDGLDIAKIGLKDLRSRLTIIPQDPTILSGTLRSTLDVFDEHTDAEIFDALRRVHLIPTEESTANRANGEDDSPNEIVFYNLDAEVSEGGANFSQGQRQLLCMARALLKRSKVLILDEATSSIDYETDEMISATIQKEFVDSTLLVIAHRLRTVITFDRILVLDAGRVLEYDSPSNLLANPESRFYSLCRSTGTREFKVLQRMAAGKYSGRSAPAPRKPVRRKSTIKK